MLVTSRQLASFAVASASCACTQEPPTCPAFGFGFEYAFPELQVCCVSQARSHRFRNGGASSCGLFTHGMQIEILAKYCMVAFTDLRAGGWIHFVSVQESESEHLMRKPCFIHTVCCPSFDESSIAKGEMPV